MQLLLPLRPLGRYHKPVASQHTEDIPSFDVLDLVDLDNDSESGKAG